MSGAETAIGAQMVRAQIAMAEDALSAIDWSAVYREARVASETRLANHAPLRVATKLESMAACLLAAQLDITWRAALVRLRCCGRRNYKDIWIMAAQAIDHIPYLERLPDEAPELPPDIYNWSA
jgi:hypothetical protein